MCLSGAATLAGNRCDRVDRVVQYCRLVDAVCSCQRWCVTCLCVMGKQTVGYKNITITVASQHATVDAASEVLMAMCSRNNYGMIGELVRLTDGALSTPLLPSVCVFVYIICMYSWIDVVLSLPISVSP